MAVMNLTQLETWLRPRIGNPTVAEIPNSVLDDCVNSAYEEIANRYVFHKVRVIATFVTVAPTGAVLPVGTARYNIPPDCLEVRSLWNLGSVANPDAQYKLEKRDEAWLANQQTDPTNPVFDEPTSYVRQRDWIELSPIPDDVYTLRLEYKQSVAYLVNGGDTPIIPDSWHKGIGYLARVKYWDEIRLDAPKAEAAMAIWNAWISTKPVEVQEEDFADNVEGVSVPTLARGASSPPRPWSSNDFDRMD